METNRLCLGLKQITKHFPVTGSAWSREEYLPRAVCEHCCNFEGEVQGAKTCTKPTITITITITIAIVTMISNIMLLILLHRRVVINKDKCVFIAGIEAARCRPQVVGAKITLARVSISTTKLCPSKFGKGYIYLWIISRQRVLKRGFLLASAIRGNKTQIRLFYSFA